MGNIQGVSLEIKIKNSGIDGNEKYNVISKATIDGKDIFKEVDSTVKVTLTSN